jgi:hypothetical protein
MLGRTYKAITYHRLRIKVAKEQIRRMTGSETLGDIADSDSNSGVRKIGQVFPRIYLIVSFQL